MSDVVIDPADLPLDVPDDDGDDRVNDIPQGEEEE